MAASLLAIGLGLTAAFGQVSPEGIVHFDDLTHYLYAKWAWHWPAYLLDEWGRPGFTALYVLPAKLGWPACRLLSAALTACGAWWAFRIAQGAGLRHAWAVIVLAYAQPLFFQLSQTTLTETALAFYLTGAVLLAQRGHWTGSAAALSPAFVTRHEAIVFLPVWLWFAWRQRVALWRLWPILWAPLLVNGLSPLAGMKSAALKLLEPRPSDQYGQGGWLTFFSRSLEAWGPGVMVLAMTGLRTAWRSRGGAMAATCIAVYFVTQTAIRALGLYASGGYARFLVAVSPLVAVAALAGWHRLWAADVRLRRRATAVAAASMVLLWLAMERQLFLHANRLDQAAELPELHQATLAVRVLTAAIVALALIAIAAAGSARLNRLTRHGVPATIVVMMLLASNYLCYPLREPPAARIISDLRAWLDGHGYRDRLILSAHIWLDHATGRELPPHRRSVRGQLERAPLGTLFAWEPQFAGCPDHGLRLEEFRSSPAFRLIHETPPAPYESNPYLRVFEKVAPWPRLDRVRAAT